MGNGNETDAVRLREVLKSVARGTDASVPFPSIATVRGVIDDRLNRAKHFPREIFSDPAWDILLAVFEAELRQVRIQTREVAIRADVPATTSQRWIKTLAQNDLLVRLQDPFDGRRIFIELSPSANLSLRRYFMNLR